MSKPVFSGYFAFSGRRNRKSYFLYIAAIAGAIYILFAITNPYLERLKYLDEQKYDHMNILLGIIFIIACVSLAIAAAQRCRDFGWTGWAALICAIPFVGWIFALAILFIPGNVGANRYGPDPLGAPEPPAASQTQNGDAEIS